MEGEWKPIEAAPKDGTAVLVHQNNWPGEEDGRAQKCDGINTCVAEWWQNEEDGTGRWVCYMDAIQDPDLPIEPTHWMPLPIPPAKGAL